MVVNAILIDCNQEVHFQEKTEPQRRKTNYQGELTPFLETQGLEANTGVLNGVHS